ncbi:uncharacterized protein PFL1_05834 [Pseudozyma flocculosa PF-1]|uniref:TLC domain-containing protein n=1 Tax=Pseudozyma flocculosa PF-1 TaxID=1277687 RepID=A0A061H1M1_9BASI|nr:uncharacterized protein PFL1_05834 [Pseudozyma flocculosa PF-1]EPQ26512.1 hypothetical protein PFL1_05834 [Pseudozyma flocculosa PF-1]
MSSFIFADRFVLPETSPLLSPRLHRLFYVSLALQHAAFHLVSNTWLKGEGKEMLKKRCWILTTMASAVMCAASLPYLADLARSGFDLHQLRPRTATVAEPLAAYFVAYLVSDLGLGSIYYRSMINLSSGWVHHIGYIFLFSWWVHRGWAHLAATAAIFELPTLIMGLASIHPPLRSNNAFTATFFATRIFYHFALALASCTEYGRSMPGVGGSWGPVVSMIVTYPMHVWWGYKCILSVRRRMRKRKLAAREVQSAKASLAASAGQLLTGLPAPDVSSAVNTPATTPGAGAVPATANFGSTGPVHTAFAKAASMARPPVNLLLPKSRRRSADAVGGAAAGPSAAAVSDEQLLKQAPLLNRRLSSKYINTQSVFTAPGRTKRYLAAQKARARRAVLRAVRTAINGRDADGLGGGRKLGVNDDDVDGIADGYISATFADGAVSSAATTVPSAVDRTLLRLDFSSLIAYLPPDFFGQDYEIREYPVEREVEGGRRSRIVGQIRRRMEVARRDMVVF